VGKALSDRRITWPEENMASKRRFRRNSCTGKQRHKTKDEAIGHATALLKGGHGFLRVYFCHFCNHFHVGHR
jgi:hypothetical protein